MNAPSPSPSLFSPTLLDSSTESGEDQRETGQLWHVFRTARKLLASLLAILLLAIAQGYAPLDQGLQDVRVWSATKS